VQYLNLYSGDWFSGKQSRCVYSFLVDATVFILLQDSGLSDSLEIITNPTTRRELTMKHILLSNVHYHWRSFLGAILHNWTPQHAFTRKYAPPKYGNVGDCTLALALLVIHFF
jgi:hypothetical protein